MDARSLPQNMMQPPGWFGALLRQMRHRRAIVLLLWAALCGVVTLHAYARNSARFQNRSMQLIMKNMGHNLWFLSASAHLPDAIAGSADLPTFPDDRIRDLAGDRQVASTYWANTLQARQTIRGSAVLLTGVAVVDDHQVTEEKAHLLEPLAPGTAALGHRLGRDWALVPGDTMRLGEREYRIHAVHPPNGTMDDARVWLPLADAQALLDMPGQANVILGFLCMQRHPLDVGLARLERRLAEAHDDLQVFPLMNLLNARALARLTTSRYLHYLLYVVMGVTGLLVAAVGWMEIHDRRHELAILMAMGAGLRTVALFFLAKLMLLALTATGVGFWLGSAASVRWLAPVMVTHTQAVAVTGSDFPAILWRMLVLIGAAALVPLARLARLDPTRILAEE